MALTSERHATPRVATCKACERNVVSLHAPDTWWRCWECGHMGDVEKDYPSLAAAMRSEVDERFFHWLAGFIDGEGCFLIARSKGDCYQPRMRVTLRDDDTAILLECQRRTGLGRVFRSKRRLDERTNDKPGVAWEVGTKADVALLVEILDRHPLRAKKARDYAIWREAVREWMAVRLNGGRVKQDWTRMLDLKAALEDVRRYVPPEDEAPFVEIPERAVGLDQMSLI